MSNHKTESEISREFERLANYLNIELSKEPKELVRDTAASIANRKKMLK